MAKQMTKEGKNKSPNENPISLTKIECEIAFSAEELEQIRNKKKAIRELLK